MTIEQNNLIENNINFAYYKANVWAGKQSIVSKDELISISLFSLTKAASTYNPSKGTKFLTYANFIIDNDIKTELKKSSKYCLSDTDEITESPCEISFDETVDTNMAIESLPEQYKKMLIDFYQTGLNQYEIADKYHVSQTKVSIILKKAKQLIREYLD